MKNNYPSTEEFVTYFRNNPPSENGKKMLTAHYLSPLHTVTATQLSKLMGWSPNQGPANLHYGKLAAKVAEEMGYPKEDMDVSFFVEFDKRQEDEEGGDRWHWEMKETLVAAIRELGWGTDKRLEDIAEDFGYDPITEDTLFVAEDKGVKEGQLKLRQHYFRERNPKIIKQAKAIAKKKYGELRCEACNFSFKEMYGERVDDFIEGHHRKSISEMKSGDVTRVEDIALLCANCHRTIHAKWPYISVEELKNIIKR